MRLLLVEDEKKVSDLVARALRAERYAVDVAEDGQRGWELAKAYDYDLIILDLMLPQLSGDGAAAAHPSQEPAGADPHSDGARCHRGEGAELRGGRRRLPHQAVRLRRADHAGEGAAAPRTGRALERAAGGGSRGRPLHAAGAPRAAAGSSSPPKEYALLEYLAANPGRVFSRTMIIEHVWDQSFEGLTNIVDVYVRHLRSKSRRSVPGQADPHRARRRLRSERERRSREHALAELPPGGLVRRRADRACSCCSARSPSCSCATTWRPTCSTPRRAAPGRSPTRSWRTPAASDEHALRGQVENLYSPEANDRFIRITRADGALVYASGAPQDARFDPAQVPPLAAGDAVERRRARCACADGARC